MVGQAPTRQVALNSGLSLKTVTTTVNKVCASGMKAIMIASQHIQLNPNEILIAGGMESMSNVPFYLKREDLPYGGFKVIDGILNDGLTDAFDPMHMGHCGKKGKPDIIMTEDEEIKRVNFDKFPSLPTVFDKANGTITAANASKLNDGAAACLLMSDQTLKEVNVEPLARIVSIADGACAPIDFPIAPVEAVKKALNLAKINVKDISRWEINEAFSCVVLANEKLLGLNLDQINVNGGAVSMGHPIG
ncbi:hypothetical protein RND71_043767 [Anisodus tanguticus]|uniref:Acetoacetyl-CoA thiolase n=1 Tax=Anisodus tanguticus TaxID=243964 RepID=A0AAE1QRG2_9SOLA|nr:hypothetical protein RND71_043767 [Anisodus tanguticus]